MRAKICDIKEFTRDLEWLYNHKYQTGCDTSKIYACINLAIKKWNKILGGNKRRKETNEHNLSELQIENISKSIQSLGLRQLREMSKFSLIQIILAREVLLINKIDEWDKSIKSNDRKIFQNLRKENKKLHSLLLYDTNYKKLFENPDITKKTAHSDNIKPLKDCAKET